MGSACAGDGDGSVGFNACHGFVITGIGVGFARLQAAAGGRQGKVGVAVGFGGGVNHNGLTGFLASLQGRVCLGAGIVFTICRGVGGCQGDGFCIRRGVGDAGLTVL